MLMVLSFEDCFDIRRSLMCNEKFLQDKMMFVTMLYVHEQTESNQ